MPTPRHQTVLLCFATFLLAGCSLTRVSDSAHAEEVDRLNIVGLRLDAAKEKISAAGFVCDRDARLSHVDTESGVQVLKQLECAKTRQELFCPQIRNVVLNVDPNTETVVWVGKYITQHGCF